MTRNCRSDHRIDDPGLRDASGFSLIELMATMVLLVTMAAFVLPFTRTTLSAMNLSSDARNLSSGTALAKMRAAAEFSRARLYVDLATKSFWVERWRKVAPIGWVNEGAITTLRSNVSFGFAGATTPPPNTQAALAQATNCLDKAGVAIAGTACIVFNSRGVPVDATSVPTPNGAFYVTADQTIYGITVGAGGLIQLWQNNIVSNTWALK
jgi:prepilin-type N-terminal cleavage/methylation domain-containing protein